MGEEIQAPIGMGWFSVNLDNESIILASNQGIQESDLVIIFFFDGKGDVLIDTNECVVERINSVSFNDAEIIANIPFPWWSGSCVDGHLFDCFHIKIGNHRTNGTAHGTTMDLFMNTVTVDEIVVG